MSKQNPKLRGCVGFGIGLGFAMAVGTASGALLDVDDQSVLKTKRVELVKHEGVYEEAARNYERTERAVGEACMTLVRVYLPGGGLAETPEHEVVSDIANTPDKACGETPTAVRLQLRTVFGANNDLSKAAIARAQGLKDVKEAETTLNESEALFGFVVGAGIGLLTGGFCAAIAASEANDHNRHEKLMDYYRTI